MSCHTPIADAPPPVRRSRRLVPATSPEANEPPEDDHSAQSPSGPTFGHRLFLFLVLVWAMAVAHSAARVSHADDKTTDETNSKQDTPHAVALPTSQVAFNVPRKAAPELKVAAWVDEKGTATPPQLRGKVQLVVFWGVNCPPCLRKIPKLQQVASKYAHSDLVVIGLHTSQISPARLQKFAHDRELNYPVAIDQQGANGYSFGMTTTAYRVRAIPQAAVVDRDGSLTYLGSFDEALQTAESLLKVTSG